MAVLYKCLMIDADIIRDEILSGFCVPNFIASSYIG